MMPDRHPRRQSFVKDLEPDIVGRSRRAYVTLVIGRRLSAAHVAHGLDLGGVDMD